MQPLIGRIQRSAFLLKVQNKIFPDAKLFDLSLWEDVDEGAWAVPPDVVGSSRAGKHGHAMVAIFVQLVHVQTAIVHVFF